MRSFSKVIISLVSIVLIFTLVSAAVICPYIYSETFYYQDKNVRADLAGDLNYLTIGSSHGLTAYKTSILDEELGCCSYNLSGGMMTFAARYYLLKKEIDRNPVDIVVIEVSHNALTSENDDGYGEGEASFLPRLDNAFERFGYLFSYVKLDDWLNVYAKTFIQSLGYYKYRNTNAVDYAAKGYHAKTTIDLTLSEEDAANSYNVGKISTDFTEGNIQYLKQMVDYCNERGIRTIIAVVPISDVLIWRCDNFDEFNKWLKDFCTENKCEFYNFNLLKNRYELFDNKTSFHDVTHMSDIGATAFTEEYCQIMKKIDKGENVSDLFFESYETSKQHSPYMKYLKKNP